ncbi:uncharacterized protein MYCFIDRAFT_80084 [Pseudocercospora fijiensis CIRAD86]|uniref:Uncharacterized protein n=1 Tax=Pseudocercospora fijiensis (strain CIRAD86) TaxID=383855 RepID=N1Q7L7_PSEFD|nr:uncharacterized protein MYCFIDRAFT_80084 [Pseudocercospora fijiensis CIRAD86]EME88704.1 hypothetical protein MYCFIDRAFT_80084 [Pseudocercospora fijiensis CIRAD86]
MTEAEFFTLCNLDQTSERGQQTYHLMRQEATAGLDRMTLTARSTPGTTEFNGHTILASMLSEAAIQFEIQRIWQFALPETRDVYEGGRMGNGNEENWIIRWMLWREIVIRRDGLGD